MIIKEGMTAKEKKCLAEILYNKNFFLSSDFTEMGKA